MKYFAYGSNLHPERLRRRVPGYRVLGATRLEGYRLDFSKRGRDGSGKCTVLPVADSGRAVPGVLYELDPRDRAALDEAEGLGAGYEVVTVRLMLGDDLHEAFTYRAQTGFIDGALRPFDWYKALVVAGAHYHGLDVAHIEWLASVPAMPDPDRRRAEEHWAILREGG